MSIKPLFILLSIYLYTFPAQAALHDRGNGLIYDDVQNITLMQQATAGLMTWLDANAWMNNLSYEGYNDWRLPSGKIMMPINPCFSFGGTCDIGYLNTNSELGYMYYVYLGGVAIYDPDGNLQPGYGLSTTSFIDPATGTIVSFINIKADTYWLLEPNLNASESAYNFSMIGGYQAAGGTGNRYHVWPVRDGDSISFEKGDVNRDGQVNLSDLLLLECALLNIITLDANQADKGDLYPEAPAQGDGQITLGDWISLESLIAGR
jgi:hypothetical protein